MISNDLFVTGVMMTLNQAVVNEFKMSVTHQYDFYMVKIFKPGLYRSLICFIKGI